ncbi:MAG: hypothetical protein JWO48_1098 [Bryobacterales bacterium]|nr:hypothetical protein [Bryobacterales bacterium]
MRPDPPQLWRSAFYPLSSYTYFEKLPLFGSSRKIGELSVENSLDGGRGDAAREDS